MNILKGKMSYINGYSAYQIALQNGFVGSEIEWLESLKGEQGPEGPEGPRGLDGKDGKDGRDGLNGKDGATVDTSLFATIDYVNEKIGEIETLLGGI